MKLKRCPLCGAKAEESKFTIATHVLHSVICLDEHCECGTGYFALKKDAVKAWNLRPLDKEMEVK